MSDSTLAIRRFSRFFTGIVGTLDRGYLDTPFTLPEARVLYEVGANPGCTASDIRESAGLDPGHLSRIVARLEKKELVTRRARADDARAREIRLSPQGQEIFTTLEGRANERVAHLTAGLTREERGELTQAMAAIERLLGAPTQPTVVVREGRMGDLGWTFYRQAVVYEREFGYTPVFERYVCDSLAPFLDHYDAKKDHLWVAEVDERIVGFVAVQHADDRAGWSKLRWFLVEREARGLGIGKRLLDEALRFAHRAGYKGMYLWTVNHLDGARHLYERAGFRLVRETDSCPWSDGAKEQMWEVEMRDGP